MKRYILRIGNLLLRFWYSILGSVTGKRGIVIVYHEIGDHKEADVPDSCFVRTTVFEESLKKLRTQYRFVAMDDFLNSNDGNLAVITFDDVPESFYQNAYPILKKYSSPFTLYISQRYIDAPGFLSSDQIKELAADALCTIGCHTMHHTKLRYEIDSYEDIKQSKDELEALVGKPVAHFAYPFGRINSVSRKNRKEAERAGFTSAVSTIPTAVPKAVNRFFIPRIIIN